MQQVLGSFASCLVFRRELFSLFHSAYRFCEELPLTGWRKLPGPILDEFRAAALLLPFMQSDIRSPIFDEIWATDATPTAGGATTAAIPNELGDFLYSHAEQRGSHVRLNVVENLTVADLRLMPAGPVVE
jgi:hypothetical protein